MLFWACPALQYLGRLQYNAKLVEGDLPLSLASYVLQYTTIPIFPGPDFHYLQTVDVKLFWTMPYLLMHKSNRHAYKLKEKITVLKYPTNFESVGVPGMVQLTPSGDLFVLMKMPKPRVVICRFFIAIQINWPYWLSGWVQRSFSFDLWIKNRHLYQPSKLHKPGDGSWLRSINCIEYKKASEMMR